MLRKMSFNIFILFMLILIVASCGYESQEDRLFEQLPMEVKSCITDRNKIVHGIDVSYYQGNIDWNKVAAEGHKFAFIRVSDGLNYIDSKFTQNWKGAKSAGIIRGAYQFFRPNLDAVAQAQLLIDKMGPLEKGDLPPVIDVENTGGLSPSQVAAQIGKWISHIETKLGVKPIIYTGYYFWKDYVKSTAFAEYLLWLAWYHDYQDTSWCPSTPEPWTKWTFWQWTSSGTVSGISGNVDRNIFDGTIDDLKKLTYLYEDICGDSYCGGEETYATCPSDCLMMDFVTPKDGDDIRNPVIFKIEADSNITKVTYYADGYLLGTSTKPSTYFAVEYTFNTLGIRKILAEGFNIGGKKVSAASISINVLPEPRCGDGECNGDEEFLTCDSDCVDISFITPKDNEKVYNPVTFKTKANENIETVLYTADIHRFATSSDKSTNFEVTYKFNVIGDRTIIAEGLNKNQKKIGRTQIRVTILEEKDATSEDYTSEDSGQSVEVINDTLFNDVIEAQEDILIEDKVESSEDITIDIRDTNNYDSIKSEVDNESSGCGCVIIE
ncbi:MAG: glycoside hydrolase family 25 protein [Deltaproteobacteria bacterium]|nr:glycoside hydrolase family 25 protein [Deltaproteobacteria bacterium]